MILKSSIEKLIRGKNLSPLICQQALHDLLDPASNPLQIAAFLVLLRAKQETVDELFSIANTLRNKMIAVNTTHRVLDIVGTGGDGFNSINISTGSALLAASCGVKVIKHGNRAVSSLTGSADVLEALGVNIQLTSTKISQSVDEIGIGFCYAPNFHPMMQALKNVRKQLNVPTTFNILGPLLSPAQTAHIILGVFDEQLLPIMADVLIKMGNDKSVVVHGKGLDEITCIGPSKIVEINKNDKHVYDLDPLDFGLPRCTFQDLRGGDAQMNATLLLNTFKGNKGPIANTLILNAAVALYLYGLSASIKDAINQTTDNLYSGAVLTLLKKWIEFSHEK